MQRDTIEKLQQTVQTLQRDKSEAATDYVKLIPSGDASIGNCDQVIDYKNTCINNNDECGNCVRLVNPNNA